MEGFYVLGAPSCRGAPAPALLARRPPIWKHSPASRLVATAGYALDHSYLAVFGPAETLLGTELHTTAVEGEPSLQANPHRMGTTLGQPCTIVWSMRGCLRVLGGPEL